MLLEIKNISKSYGAQRVLCAINQSFGEGRIVGLLGPNGAGKSTLMKIITGYISADEGEVLIDGKRVAVDDVATKRLVGYLPEHNPLYLDMYWCVFAVLILWFLEDFRSNLLSRKQIAEWLYIAYSSGFPEARWRKSGPD